ncbi:hypothetical protein BUE80_DR009100 [Diplocarpon rosae]|nr:hypothetical protein BUE80_DR009100 [Diplocarpon rosae]
MKLSIVVVLVQAFAAHAFFCGTDTANLGPSDYCPSGKPTCCSTKQDNYFPTSLTCVSAKDAIGQSIAPTCLGGVSLLIPALPDVQTNLH